MVLTWFSGVPRNNKLMVALFSTEVEYQALAHASTKIAWMQNLFQELHISVTFIPILWCDNTSARALASNLIFHAHTKHIEIDVHFVREIVASKRLTVQYVSSKFQIADMLTKALFGPRFQRLRESLTILPFFF